MDVPLYLGTTPAGFVVIGLIIGMITGWICARIRDEPRVLRAKELAAQFPGVRFYDREAAVIARRGNHTIEIDAGFSYADACEIVEKEFY